MRPVRVRPVTFSVGGVYTLKLTVSDSVLSGSDTVVITVNKAPAVNAGPDQTVPTPSAVVNGSATDDGLPNPPGALTYTWTEASGPGTATFVDPTAASTAVTFSAGGVYTLKLTANDGHFPVAIMSLSQLIKLRWLTLVLTGPSRFQLARI